MKKRVSEEQAQLMMPVVAVIQELTRTLEQHKSLILRMAGAIDPRVLDPTSGVRFNVDTLTFIYPSENGDGHAE